jgi:hypothetical protein
MCVKERGRGALSPTDFEACGTISACCANFIFPKGMFWVLVQKIVELRECVVSREIWHETRILRFLRIELICTDIWRNDDKSGSKQVPCKSLRTGEIKTLGSEEVRCFSVETSTLQIFF